MAKFSIRRFDKNVVQALVNRGYPEPVARAFAARDVASPEDLSYELKELLPPSELLNCTKAGEVIADAIWNQKQIVIVGDFDCDGATSTALGLVGLASLGAQNVTYIIPDREKEGYGLSEALVDKAKDKGAGLIVTVDNGISSVQAVSYAKSLGIDVVVTDHHLPGETIPDTIVVNPNQQGDSFPSKSLAGVGVFFYVLMATRAVLRDRGAYPPGRAPNLLRFIDLVALGTVADVVKLDKNNRILVTAGLNAMREGRMQPGISALLQSAGKNVTQINTSDLGFILAPRINASGRLNAINTGVECLASYEFDKAQYFASQLESFNRERRSIEQEMQADALIKMQTICVGDSKAVALKGDDWHAGIVGLVASRIREKTYRPTIAFAPSEENNMRVLKGSGRSISGVHLRDTLDLVNKRNPGLIQKFGGHALAAGLTIPENKFELFKEAFEAAVIDVALPGSFEQNIATDGELKAPEFCLEVASAIKSNVWGPGFPEPVFCNRFNVTSQKILKGQHLKLTLETDGKTLSAIWFRRQKEIPPKARLAYKLDVNNWNGRQSVQLIIEGMDDEPDPWGS